MGELIAGFVDELVLKEDERRGRKVGETSALLKQGALKGGLSEDAILPWQSEPKAVNAALKRAQPGDLVVIFASKYHDVWHQITSFKSEEAHSQNGNSRVTERSAR
jgi:cyanophycin synthetase